MITFGGQDDSNFVKSKIDGEGTFNVVLQKWGNESIKKLRKSLIDNISDGTTRDLLQSLIALPIQVGEGNFVLTLKAEHYYKFIDEGVQGVGGLKTAKKGKQEQWINKAPQSPFKFKDKKPPLRRGEGLSLWAYSKGFNEFAVRESVFRQGIEATNFYSDIMNEKWIGELVNRLEKSGAKEIELVIVKEFRI